jgi:hypothetical protein
LAWDEQHQVSEILIVVGRESDRELLWRGFLRDRLC